MAQDIYTKLIEDLWTAEIKYDYNNGFLLREDSLRCAIYYHLRRRLHDDFKHLPDIRIFAEFQEFKSEQGKQLRPDLVVVELKSESERENERFLKNQIAKFLAVVEIKYKGYKTDPKKSFHEDCEKLEEYSKIPECEGAKFMGIFLFDWPYEQEPDWFKDHKGITKFIGYNDESSNLRQVTLL